MSQDNTINIELKDAYTQTIAPNVKSNFNLKNIHQVPKLRKIVLNVGVGRNKDDKKHIETVINTLSKITGQKPYSIPAKKSISSFKLREGNLIGIKVTLRGTKMYEFLYRLINIVLPRQRDFHGVKIKSFDKEGNYTLGISEQSIFPELTFEETTTNHGMEISLVFDNANPELTKEVLKGFGFPFEKELK